MDSYSHSVIKLFKDLKGKRKLVDIVNLLEDLTSYYIEQHELPVELLLQDLDMAIENDEFKGFTKVQLKKIYNVLNKFDKNKPKVKTKKKDKSIPEKLIDSIKSQTDSSTNKMDEFLLELRQRLQDRVKRSKSKVNLTEEYHDEFNSQYLRLFVDSQTKEFAIIVIQNSLVMYYSHITKRQYPINLKKSRKGLDTLVNVFIERDLEYIDTKDDD